MSASGKWSATVETPLGAQKRELVISVAGATFTGTVSSKNGPRPIAGKVDGDRLTWTADVTDPMPMTLDFDISVTGDTLAGTVKLGGMGNAKITGTRIA